MSEELEQILGDLRVKVLRFFFRNEGQYFSTQEIAKRTQIASHVSSELERLHKIRILARKKVRGKNHYSLNRDFYFYKELKNLILKSDPYAYKKLSSFVRKLGSVKLAIISGILINQENARVDLFIVGDYIVRKKFSNFLKKLEVEVGREITYSVITTVDFRYRQSMFDNFISEVLQKPHIKLINRLGI